MSLATTHRSPLAACRSPPVASAVCPTFASATVTIRLTFALAIGGYLLKNRTSLEYLCPSEHIPQKIEVDLSKLDIGGKVLARDVLPHPSLKLRKIVGYKPICKILAAEPKDPKTKLGRKETKTDDPATKLGRKETKTNDSTTNLGRKETKTNEPKTKPGRKETKANDPKAKLGRKETKTAVGEA
ncbi:hypothetical protein ZIOFF_019171 [Zingiber officinale]|uniref:Large ribosomal subunit protein bL25 beta domain-containing protein n=1 Tax=Zingiber officinale TaxID=94328 RepID=A0A8J5H960_ZINOF|nr:hypothetical protein ZIOFF_019171 [Zingiber officinale]